MASQNDRDAPHKKSVNPVEPQDAASNGNNNRNSDPSYKRFLKWLRQWKPVIEILTLVVILIYTCVAYKQWNAMLNSNDINREALTSVQRAFVNFQNHESVLILNQQSRVVGWRIRTMWENSGTTPAKTARHDTNHSLRDDPLPENFEFPDSEEATTGTKFVIGPRVTVRNNGRSVSADHINLVRDRINLGRVQGKHLFLWGWVAYRDVFSQTKVHVTEFCNELTGITGSIVTGEGVRFIYSPCPKHNCYDEDCEDYAEIAKKLEAE